MVSHWYCLGWVEQKIMNNFIRLILILALSCNINFWVVRLILVFSCSNCFITFTFRIAPSVLHCFLPAIALVLSCKLHFENALYNYNVYMYSVWQTVHECLLSLSVLHTYLLLTKFEGCTICHGPPCFYFNLWRVPSLRALNWSGKKVP